MASARTLDTEWERLLLGFQDGLEKPEDTALWRALWRQTPEALDEAGLLGSVFN